MNLNPTSKQMTQSNHKKKQKPKEAYSSTLKSQYCKEEHFRHNDNPDFLFFVTAAFVI